MRVEAELQAAPAGGAPPIGQLAKRRQGIVEPIPIRPSEPFSPLKPCRGRTAPAVDRPLRPCRWHAPWMGVPGRPR